jgi:hypothetical protein
LGILQFILDLFLERPLGYFIWEVYMPATFIVAMSFTRKAGLLAKWVL